MGRSGLASDLEGWEPAATQRQHTRDAARVDGAGGTFGARTTVKEAAVAFGAKAGEPLVSGALGDAESGGHLGHGLMEIHEAADLSARLKAVSLALR